MVMKSLRGGKVGGFFKYVVFGLLGMAVGGLVLSGSFSNGNVGGNDVAKIEDKTITIRQFDNTLRRTLASYNMSTQQAYKIGMADDVLANEIRSYFMLKEAEKLGIEINKEQIAKHIGQVIAPHKRDDQTLQEALNEILRRQGMIEKDFVTGIKREVSGEIIKKAIQSGFKPNLDELSSELHSFENQTRDIKILMFPDSEISNIQEPDEGQLKGLYEATKFAKYVIPESRSAEIAVFDSDKIETDMSVSDKEIEQFYNDNKQNFKIGEQIVLTQSIADNKQQADDIFTLVQEGKSLKDASEEIVGENAKYIENIPFETTLMLPALSDAVSDRKIEEVKPPVQTTLGFHIVKLVKIIPPSTQPLNQVKNQIQTEILESKKSDHIFDIFTKFENMLDDGTSFENIAKEINISIELVNPIDSKGLNKQGKIDKTTFTPADKEALTEMLFLLEDGAQPIAEELPSGKFVSIALTSIEQKTHKPFDSVKDEIHTQYIADQKYIENKKRMDKYLAELDVKGSTFESIAKENNIVSKDIKGIRVIGEMPAPLKANNRPTIFQSKVGDHQTIRLDDKFALIKIAGYEIPKVTSDNQKSLDDINQRLQSELEEEALLVYLNMLSKKYNATINTNLLKRVYGQQADEN
ncbi:MAG: peptidylprolyl isomerase [Alphaproteobacteria bacterium]